MPNDLKVQADRLRRAIRVIWSNVCNDPNRFDTPGMVAHKAAKLCIRSGAVSVEFALRHAEPLAELMLGQPEPYDGAKLARVLRAMRLEMERLGIPVRI